MSSRVHLHMPHIVAVIADDYGWGNIGYHRATPNREVVTPRLDALMRDGVELTRHYAYKFCSPSRSAFQSGRLPVHVNMANVEPTVRNPSDPIGGFAGIPVNMTGVAQKLRSAGYRTHFTGKWDCGMATPRHTPIGRGYESWIGYYHHANDYWTEQLPFQAIGAVDVCANRYADLWLDNGPASHLNGTAYEEEFFTNHSLAVIAAHDARFAPLFLVHAFHIAHTPLQVPHAYEQRFDFIEYRNRRTYAAMVHYMDGVVGRLVDALRTKGMWERTLLLFTADNGGALYYPASGSNHPLLGGKLNDFEGGVRVAAFLSGGFLPAAVRGTRLDSLIHIADWYATFSALAGVNGTSDPEAASVGLPPIDSINVWPQVLALGASTGALASSGATEGGTKGGKPASRAAGVPKVNDVRDELHLSESAILQRGPDGQLYKLVTGWQVNVGWAGAMYPNATGSQPLPSPPWKPSGQHQPVLKHATWARDCGTVGCLYDVANDETEHHNLEHTLPELARRLKVRLDQLNERNYNPDRGAGDQAACAAAEDLYHGFYGPWVGL